MSFLINSAQVTPTPLRRGGILFALLVIGVMVAAITTPYKALASVSYAFMIFGFVCRRERASHASFMRKAVFTDLAVVIALELQRHAVATAAAMTLGPWQQVHIYASTATVLLYIPLFLLGTKRLNGTVGENGARWHRQLGMAAFLLRTIGFVLMFTMTKV